MCVKDEARVLDATAGNRRMWRVRESPNILYLDVEPELEYDPDLVGDNEDTSFRDGRFHTIFYDPPHGYGETSGFYINKNHQESRKYWSKYDRSEYIRKYPRYYGLDKYKSKKALLNHVAQAQKEFHRILCEGGCLWLKWCETNIGLKEALKLFINWDEMMRIYVKSPSQNQSEQAGKKSPQTYWVMLMKKNRPPLQEVLS